MALTPGADMARVQAIQAESSRLEQDYVQYRALSEAEMCRQMRNAPVPPPPPPVGFWKADKTGDTVNQ